MQYYIHHNNEQIGPFTEAEVKAKLAAGEVSASDHVWWEGQPGWVPLSQTPLAGGTPVIPGAVAAAFPVGTGTTQTTNLPLWALICGIIALLFTCPSYLCAPVFILGIIPMVAAVVLGHMSLSAIKKNPGLEGRGMAMSGLVMGYVSVGMLVVYIIIVVVFVGFNHNFKDVMEKIQQQINSAQAANGTLPEQSTNNSSSTTNSLNQSTSSSTATNPDSSTNSSTTNAPASSTNTAPTSQ